VATPQLDPADDPYRILGVPPGTSPDEITRAYRRLVRQYHPDTAPTASLPEENRRQLQRVLAAYHALRHNQRGDERRPATPVRVRRHTQRRTPPQQTRADRFYLGTGAAAPKRRIPIAQRGAHTAAAVTITTAQARTGVVITLAAPRYPTELGTTQVRIPAGTGNGQTLRIPERGRPGHNGGPPGDLHLTVYHRG